MYSPFFLHYCTLFIQSPSSIDLPNISCIMLIDIDYHLHLILSYVCTFTRITLYLI